MSNSASEGGGDSTLQKKQGQEEGISYHVHMKCENDQAWWPFCNKTLSDRMHTQEV